MSLSTTVNGRVSCALQDDDELYPSFDTIMTAIQDAGKEKKAKDKETGVVVVPDIKRRSVNTEGDWEIDDNNAENNNDDEGRKTSAKKDNFFVCYN